MKRFFLIAVFVCLGCRGQTVIPMYNADKNQSGVYYKDTFNDFDKFVGTWKYTNGSTSLTITLRKKLEQSVNEDNGTYYDMDFVVGGYKYVENDVVKINTLAQLDDNLEYIFDYHLVGYTIGGPKSYLCLDCGPNDRILLLGFKDPYREIEGYEPEMLFKRVDSGGVQKLELIFRTTPGGWEIIGETPEYTTYTVPFGTYVLIKQP